MDPADTLLDKIFSLVDLKKHSADELNELAAELEKQRKAVNRSQVAGSVVSAVGSAALLTAGLCTGGAAVSLLALGGKAVSWLGVGINISSEVVNGVNSKINKKEKEIYEKIQNLEKEIQTLTESVMEEGKKAGVPENDQEQYVTERILRAMAKRFGLMLDTQVTKLASERSKQGSGSCAVFVAGTLTYLLISQVIIGILKKRAGQRAGYIAIRTSTFEVSKQTVKVVGTKAASKTLKRITQGACGIVFSGAELIYTIATLNNCETDRSKSLRKRSKDMKTQAETMKEELDAAKHELKELADVKNSIESKERSPTQKKKLKEFAKKQSKYDSVRKWLEEEFEAFLVLVNIFNFLRDKMGEEGGKIDRQDIDVIFVAHGAIENPPVLADSLLPLSTIQDVVLYTPWNCVLSSSAAYGIARGWLEPRHRVFLCADEENCEVTQEGHQPTDLPGDWNSMKDAGEKLEMIPTISVSPLKVPQDGAWNFFEVLQDKYGRPGKNRILIPFILPGVSEDFKVPFSVVTLALSLVLYFSCYKATVHLAACLGRSETISDEFKLYLQNRQYSYTVDETAMTSSREMLDGTRISRLFKELFG